MSVGSDGEGSGTPLQYSCQENAMDGGAWWATALGVAKSLTRLSNFTFFHFLLNYTNFRVSFKLEITLKL